MRTTIDSPQEEGVFSEYQTLENNTWSSLTSSITPSLNRAEERPSEPSYLWHPEVPVSLKISTAFRRFVVTDHWTPAEVGARGSNAENLISCVWKCSTQRTRCHCWLWVGKPSNSQLVLLIPNSFLPLARMWWNSLREFPIAAAFPICETRWDHQISRWPHEFPLISRFVTSRATLDPLSAEMDRNASRWRRGLSEIHSVTSH